jgi:hypothetical protein
MNLAELETAALANSPEIRVATKIRLVQRSGSNSSSQSCS